MSDENEIPEAEEAAPSGRRVYRKGIAKAKMVKESRGRPAERQVIASDYEEEDPSKITRRSRHDGGANDFDVPERAKKAGWDYQWITISVINQPVDGAELNRSYEGGWRPVPARDMPMFCPPGYEKKTIERYGQMLMMRPMRLTQEARREDYEIAEKQKQDKLMAASAVSTNRPSSMPSILTEMTIEGSVGMHRQSKNAA